MPRAGILFALLACVFGLNTAALAQGNLTLYTVSSWSSTITQVGGGTTTYLSTDPSNWVGLSSPNYVGLSGIPGPSNPYGSVAAYQSFVSPTWDLLFVAGAGGGLSGPPADLTSLQSTFEINVTSLGGIEFRAENFVNTSSAAWSVRATSSAFGTGSVLTSGTVIGVGTWAIDYVSTTTASDYTEAVAHFSAVPGSGFAAVMGMLASGGRRRRR